MSTARTLAAALAAAALALSGCSTAVGGEAVPSGELAASAATAAPAPTWVQMPERPVPDSALRLDVDGQQYGAAPYPGVQLMQDLGGDLIESCTAGPLVRDAAGRQGFLTAGHCDAKTGAAVYTYTAPESGDWTRVGRYEGKVVDDLSSEDFALLRLDTAAAPAAAMIAGKWAAAGVLAEGAVRTLPIGTPVCISGSVTGVRCGELAAPPMSRIIATIGVEDGDSGAAMFVVGENGRATVIGIVERGHEHGVYATYAAHAMDRLGVEIVPA